MKKTVRILAVFMIVAMLSVSLVACGNSISGKYSATFDVDIFGIGVYEATTTYEFGLFGKVTKTVVLNSILGDAEPVVTEGKYEIMEDPKNPDQLIIAFEFEGEERTTHSYVTGVESGVQYIKIDGRQYNIVK